jgi:hypothetical protein
MVLDGVAPADMVLPQSFATGAQAALDAVFDDCAQDSALLPERPGPVAGPAGQPAAQDHGGPPFTGQPETFTLTRAMLASLVLPPLYAPLTASALPLAVLQASQGRFEALVGLGLGAMGGGRGLGLATGMHFSVICAEDVPRMKPGGEAALTDFGDFQERLYRESCRDWPRGDCRLPSTPCRRRARRCCCCPARWTRPRRRSMPSAWPRPWGRRPCTSWCRTAAMA